MFFRRKKRKDKLGLALGGGGVRGIAHISFLKVLDELEIKPAAISGTSIGALYASGMSGKEIEGELGSMRFLDRVGMVDLALGRRSGLIKGNRIHSWLRELTGEKSFRDLDIPLKVVAADFWRGQPVILDKGPVSDAVRASISVPGIFEPVLLEGRVLIDGGAVDPLPYDILPSWCDIRAAIDVTGTKVPEEGGAEMPNIFESINSSFQILEITLIESRLRASKPDIYIKPVIPNVGSLEFSRAGEMLKASGKAAETFRKKLSGYRLR